MKLVRCILLPVLGGLALSSSAFGYNFSKADKMFASRSGGFEMASKARNEYEKAFSKTLTAGEEQYAVTQMARLDIYRGGLLPNIERETVKEVFDGCLKNLKKIEGAKTQEYYYYHVACLGFRGKAANSRGARAGWALKLKDVQDAAVLSTKKGEPVEGLGIFRVLSAVRGNRQAKALPGLYNPAEAVEYAQKALKAPKTEIAPYPDKLSGSDYHENYYYLALAQMAVGLEDHSKPMVKAALKTLEDAIGNLTDLEDMDELPKGREPETVLYKAKMEKSAKLLSSCLSQGEKWRSCLLQKLD